MANICSTDFVYVGSMADVSRLHDALQSLQVLQGKLSLGLVMSQLFTAAECVALGYTFLESHNQDLRCWIEAVSPVESLLAAPSAAGAESDHAVLRLKTQSEWGPYQQMLWLGDKFKLATFFFAQDANTLTFATNDRDGRFFPAQYVVCGGDGERLFKTFAEVAQYLKDSFGVDAATPEAAQQALQAKGESTLVQRIEVVTDQGLFLS